MLHYLFGIIVELNDWKPCYPFFSNSMVHPVTSANDRVISYDVSHPTVCGTVVLGLDYAACWALPHA